MTFPKRNTSNSKGVSGQSFFHHYVNNNLDCIYHPISQENDFGIDGYIELVQNGNVTGKLVGVQLKHGDSFFKTQMGKAYKYVGDNKHLNYYLNSQTPIFIVIMDDNFKRLHWVEFDISQTNPSGKNMWWMEIPQSNELYTNFQSTISHSVGVVIDYDEEIKRNWAIDKMVQNSDYRVIAIPKEEIEGLCFHTISDIINRLSKNHDLLVRSKSSVDIFFPDYDEDAREIFQIPEIMYWLKCSMDSGLPWFYFLYFKHRLATGLKLLVHAYCSSMKTERRNTGFYIVYDNMDLGRFFEKNFDNLNKFMKLNNLSEELNKEISTGIIEFYKNELL